MKKKRKIRMSFEKYCKFCSRIAKEYGLDLEIDPIGKYPGELKIEYKYNLSVKNKWPERYKGTKVIFPVRWYETSSGEMFKGFDLSLDWRYQLTEEELRKNIEHIIEREKLNE